MIKQHVDYGRVIFAELKKTTLIPLKYAPPPAIKLATNNTKEILSLLNYACLNSFIPNSPAEQYAVDVFKFAREFILANSVDRVTFDWDHTLCNYLVIDGLSVFPAKFYTKKLPAYFSSAPLTVLEVARPFMHELVFGMMVGFAIKQQLQSLTEWESYVPQVGIVTLTWPDRLAGLVESYVPLLSLIEGYFPGKNDLPHRIMNGTTRAFIHSRDFINYISNLLDKVKNGQYSTLSSQQKIDVQECLKLGKGHKLKAPGLLEEKGWLGNNHMHFDDCLLSLDCLSAYKEKKIFSILVRQPQSDSMQVREIDKIYFPALYNFSARARKNCMRYLAKNEYFHSTLPAIISTLSQGMPLLPTHQVLSERSTLAAGICLNFYESSTSIGDFWQYYLQPAKKVKNKIRAIKKIMGDERE